ncbi:transposase [Candidatus Electronema sp. TJ]|uniref:transposase n=1 Tax=Candidatus Electronema sp. TJ TaxID=3401573 RepID=UPI003AA917AD
MPFNPDIHHRRSIRLPGYDYTSTGAYFVTICAKERQCLFGAIENGQMRLNDAGLIAEQCWRDIPLHFPHAALDEMVVMPNHMHGIVFIHDDNVGAKNLSPYSAHEPAETKNLSPRFEHQPAGAKDFLPLHGTSKTIGSIVRGFKIGVTRWMRQHTDIYEVWQRNFYERVIRDEAELSGVREYIRSNPALWATDELHMPLAGST